MPTPVPPKEPCYSQKMQRSRTARPLDHLKDPPCCFGEQRFFSPRRLLAPPFFTKPFSCDIPHFVMTGKRPRWGQVLFFRLIGQKVQPKGMVIQKLPKFHNERILDFRLVIDFRHTFSSPDGFIFRQAHLPLAASGQL